MTLYLYETRFGNTKKLAEFTYGLNPDPGAVLAEMDGFTYNRFDWSPVYREAGSELSIQDPTGNTEPVVLFVPTYENIREQRQGSEALRYASSESLIYAQELSLLGRLVGVVIAGNRTFGSKFCAAKQDMLDLNLPEPVRILREVELFGEPSDWKAINEAVEEFNER